MRRIQLLLGVLSLLAATTAPASSQPVGLALRWDHCYGEGTGLFNRAFACNVNTGFDELVGSFMLAADLPLVNGNEIVIDILPAPPIVEGPQIAPPSPLSDWWRFVQAGTCRRTSLSVSFAMDQANTVCQDWGAGQQVGGIGNYQIELHGPGTARLVMAEAVPPGLESTLLAGTEYYSFTLRIQHDKTVGTGACVGCEGQEWLFFTALNITTPSPPNNVVLRGPLNGTDSDAVSWNQGGVPTRGTTWSALKALYR